MKKAKILVITFSFPTGINQPAGIFILNQLEHLKQHYNIKVVHPYPYVPGFKFKYYKLSKVQFRENISGIEVYRPRYLRLPRNRFTINLILILETFFSHICSKRVLDKLAKEWNFDIVHTHGLVPDSIIALKCAGKYKKPIVVTLHGEDVTKYSKMPLLHGMSKFILKKCDEIVCVSKSLEDEIHKTGLSNKPMHVIPSGYNDKMFRPLGMGKCRKILGVRADKKIILFVGHLIERKGVEYLIRALKILSSNEDFLCYIVGTGILESRLKNLASELGLKNKIIFVGQKNPDEIPLWMNSCDILVLPSLNEGLPNVVSEALACGKPVVATKVAGTPEIVNEDVGYLVIPKNYFDLAGKISLALSKKWDKEKLLKKAKKFSAASSAEKMSRIYDKMLNRK